MGREGGIRTLRLAGLAGLLALSALAALPAAAPAAKPSCLTPVSADGHEPPCNPHMSSQIWGVSHRGPYAQASSPYPGPRPGDDVTYEHFGPTLGIPIVLQFTEPYPDGDRAIFFSTVATPDGENVYKMDYETGELVGNHGRIQEGDFQPQFGSVSGAYSTLDDRNRLTVGRFNSLDVYADVDPADSSSPIRKVHSVDLTSALCRPSDRLVGITLLHSGQIAFATEQAVIGVIPRHPAQMTIENLKTRSLNGARCDDASVPDDALEKLSNSIAADEDGGIYPVTSHAMYKLSYRRGKLRRVWRGRYETGGSGGGARLGAGSGSTPSLMGTDPGDDRFVVITDGQDLMHLVLMWRDEIPKGHKPIAPGKDRRIACEIPITFGDPAATESLSEQSVLVRGNSAFVVNNSLALDALFGFLPEQVKPLSVLSGQIPGNEPRGLERVDWKPRKGRCVSKWANPDVAIPNGIPTMSTATGLIYGIGLRDSHWGVEGIDVETGRPKLWLPSSLLPTDNSFFAATTVGPDGSIWTGTFLGVTAFRNATPLPEPELSCKDFTDPRTILKRVAVSRRGVKIRGKARDRACGDSQPVKRVEVAAQRLGKRCRALRKGGRLRRPGGCDRLRFLPAKGKRSFSFKTNKRLPRGRYAVWARATDRVGNVEPAERSDRVVKRVGR